MSGEKVWAIIPARSGSKGFPNKNIAEFENKPLLVHSIDFARKLSFVDNVIVSTDSKEYAKIAMYAGAEVPFLRSDLASCDDSMEQDVLEDIRVKCNEYEVSPPDYVLWLRPTHPIRSVSRFEEMYKMFSTGKYDSVVAVTKEDPRVFTISKDGYLDHITDVEYFLRQSMQRRQEAIPYFRMYHGELFPFPNSYNPRFLGTRIGVIVLPDDCKKDIDYEKDL